MKIKNTLYSSSFREIYLITKIEKGRRVYFPLRMILLLADLYLFVNILARCPTSIDYPPYKLGDRDYSISEFMNLYSFYIKTKIGEVFIREINGIPEVLLGNSGIIWTDDGISVHDYHDHCLPEDAILVNDSEIMNFFKDNYFASIEKEVNAGYVFEMEHAWELLTDLEF